MTELYRLFLRSVRQAFSRQLGSQDLDDILHDSFLIVVQSIRRGELREPERLAGKWPRTLRRCRRNGDSRTPRILALRWWPPDVTPSRR